MKYFLIPYFDVLWIFLTCLFLKKDTKVFKGESTNFEFLKGYLLILVTYLAEIIHYLYILSQIQLRNLPISTGTLSKLEICALILGNFKNEHVNKYFT